VLTQFRIFDDDPHSNNKRMQEVVIAYFSKHNTDLESQMGATELECFAVAQALLHFRPYIWGRKVTVITDAKALQWLLTKDQLLSSKMLRWAMRILEFDVHIQHRSGKSNANADTLSRMPLQNDDQHTSNDEWPETVATAPAPKQGVTFESDTTPLVGAITTDGAMSLQPYGPIFKLTDVLTVRTAQDLCGYTAALAGITMAELNPQSYDVDCDITDSYAWRDFNNDMVLKELADMCGTTIDFETEFQSEIDDYITHADHRLSYGSICNNSCCR
jgi:hypothetical protein